MSQIGEAQQTLQREPVGSRKRTSGQGELEWSVVGPTLYRHLDGVNASVILYAPHEAPAVQATRAYLASQEAAAEEGPAGRIDPTWLAVTEIAVRVHETPHVWPLGRTRFHKLVYFATAAGIPTGLEFRRGSYGPFAEDLKRTLTRLANNGLVDERRRGRLIELVPGPTYTDAAKRFDATIRSYDEPIERVADLLRRLDGRRTELAATVHYCAQQLALRERAVPSEADVLDEAQEWKLRRQPPFTACEIGEVIRDLAMLGWVNVEPSRGLPVDDDVVTVA